MDPAWMAIQHPCPPQHLQQHQRWHIEQEQRPPVGLAARVIPYVPRRRAAGRQGGNFHPGQEQHAVHHLPTQVNSIQVLVPAACLPLLHLQPLSPVVTTDDRCSSQQSYWLPMPTYGYSSLPEARFDPQLLSQILCPQMVPVYPTHYAEEVYVSTPAHITTASQWTEAHARPGGQGSMTCVKEDCDRPGPPASLHEEAVNKDSSDQCFRLLESFYDQLLPDEAEEPREEEHGEAGDLNMENSSFLEYLEELCRDEEFVSEVESTVNIEFFTSPLTDSRDLCEELQQEMILQEALPPTPATPTTRKRGRSAGSTGVEMDQLGPSPPKKSKRRK